MDKSVRVRILIADDHAIVRRGLRALLSTEPDLQVVGEAANGIEAVERARSLHPDVIVLDMKMPRLDGVGVINAISQELPEARVLVLTSFSEEEHLFPAIRGGALGYLLKECTPEELLGAIRAVARGEAALHPAIARKVLRELREPEAETGEQPRKEASTEGSTPAETPASHILTEREIEVLRLVARGLSNQQIAEQLVIAERTARTHVSTILMKLQLANRTQAALYAVREGLADSDSSSDAGPQLSPHGA